MATIAKDILSRTLLFGQLSSLLVLFTGSSLADEPDTGRLVDLTHPFGENTLYWPTEDGFRLERGPAGVTERGYRSNGDTQPFISA